MNQTVIAYNMGVPSRQVVMGYLNVAKQAHLKKKKPLPHEGQMPLRKCVSDHKGSDDVTTKAAFTPTANATVQKVYM